MTPLVPVPKPSYSQARENLVKAIPPKIICLLACGGRDCRYEGPACWRPSQQAIKGLFSSWVTDDIVAMARPSTDLIKRYNILEQFKKLNIKSIINMQLPGEHDHCGPDLEPDSGFTYSPQIFMENQIYFYNFGMTDFGVSSMIGMLDAVKVLAFSVEEGKVAVHCHAGLGRTGVLIACYLIYTLRISASEAIHYVRIKRPRSIQTRAQINLVFDFARLLGSQLAQYPCLSMRHGAAFSLRQYLQRQALLLHGEEARSLAHTPKILHILCSLLTAIAQGTPSPPEVQVHLERKAAILALQGDVRDTLVLHRYLPVLTEGEGSVSSWDEPFGFLERKRAVLLNKRSYSESDLSKVTLNKDFGFIQCSTSFTDDGKVCNGTITHLREQRSTNPAINILMKESSSAPDRYTPSSPRLYDSSTAKRAKSTMKKAQPFPKFSSTIELCKNHESGKVSLASRMVAEAMAQQDPPGDKILQKAAQLQDELNVNAYGWAMLAMETDPKVLSTLMWTWFEKLKDPILSADDVDKLCTNTPGQNPLKTLHKSQRSTVCCLLGCVGQVTAHCPQTENAILQRLIRALTRRPPEEIASSGALLKVLRATVRELQCVRPATASPTTHKSS
ncbi:protein tyrosine phosphatase domain-containing protein 1 [Colossoma macropomum]|uniref:protein tyrosine phosphatase domain-containing protein 1 n=1 Tax=Colossoma macropomum TaxID=42526 RepID=UPI0018652200|nr:protein tyrosine phosphatase domain-containing protein 1 [Colossoma macropomum]